MFAWRFYEIHETFFGIVVSFGFWRMLLAVFRLNSSSAFSINAVSIYIYIDLTKFPVLDVSARYLIHWELDGLGISPAVEQEVCKYVCCMLPKIDTKKSLLSREWNNLCILADHQCWQDFAWCCALPILKVTRFLMMYGGQHSSIVVWLKFLCNR